MGIGGGSVCRDSGEDGGDGYTMTAVATYAGREYREGYQTVGYAGLLPANLYRRRRTGRVAWM